MMMAALYLAYRLRILWAQLFPGRSSYERG